MSRIAPGAGSVIRARTRIMANGLVGPVGPLVDVVAGLELSGVGLGEDVDALEPLHGGDGVPVGHDQRKGAPWSGPSGSPFIS